MRQVNCLLSKITQVLHRSKKKIFFDGKKIVVDITVGNFFFFSDNIVYLLQQL